MGELSRRELVDGEHDDICYDLLYVDMDEMRSIADICQAKQNEGHWHLGKGPDAPRVLAEFPRELVEKYCIDQGVSMHEWVVNPVHHRRMLKDPALAKFRIHPGGV